MRKCKKCNQDKDISDFYESPSCRDGIARRCKMCMNKANGESKRKYRENINAKRQLYYELHPEKRIAASNRSARLAKTYRYGITQEEYDRMYKEQNGVCKICNDKSDKMHIDHCHSTNVIRGLLCHCCNIGLGMFRENPELFKRAIEYLALTEKLSTSKFAPV